MNGVSPLVLSVAMLAVFALALGGAWLVVKARDRRRGILMMVAALVVLGNVLVWAWPS